jgi:cob(I)alamin adenosyltransferase
MVRLNKIYTRTGDDGTTGLGTGQRVAKCSTRVEAYGTVDETNAAIGLVRALLGPAEQDVDARLARIQNDLFDLGADLCTPETPETKSKGGVALRISPEQVARLEAEIDELNGVLAPLRSFVLPGGTAAAAALHVARTVCRRAEREMVRLAAEPGETVAAPSIAYVNRLSDFLFVASRYLNNRGHGDVLWVPGQNR